MGHDWTTKMRSDHLFCPFTSCSGLARVPLWSQPRRNNVHPSTWNVPRREARMQTTTFARCMLLNKFRMWVTCSYLKSMMLAMVDILCIVLPMAI